jgi:hypothetical protein
MKSPTLLITICLGILLLLLPLTPAINIHTIQTTHPNSPLFNTRISRLTSPNNINRYSTYIGQYTALSIPIPSRALITTELITQLSEKAQTLIKPDPDLQHKWTIILDLLPSLLDQLNSYYRENQGDLQPLLSQYRTMDSTTLEKLLCDQLQEIPLDDLQQLKISQPSTTQYQNFTSGIICNITSGSICSITSQPICALTLHPICTLITMTPPCNTMMGIRCPTAGLKCVPPTTGALCLFLRNLGPIFKALFIITIIGLIIFLPAIAIVTILAPDVCTNLKNRLTVWFNCSTNYTKI